MPVQEPPRVPGWLLTTSAVSWRVLVMVAALAAAVFALSQVAVVAIAVFVAAVLASVLWVPASGLRKLRLPPGLAALVVVLAFLGGIVGVGLLLGPPVSRELSTRGKELVRQGEEFLGKVVERTPLPGNNAADALEKMKGQIGQRADAVAGVLAAGALRVGELITSVLLTIVLLFFFLRDGDRLVRWFLERTTSTRREDMRAVLDRAWFTLRHFVGGTAVVALADALGIGLGLWIIGVPLVLPLMVLTFFAAFVPIIGATVAGLVAVLVALGAGGITDAALTLAVVLVVQQLESNVLEPFVLGRAVPLHPVVILVAISSAALIWGVLGAFVAVPVAAMLSAAGNELRQRGLLGIRAPGVA
jgi:predicted PurR-regulated permease PerM